MKLKVVSYLVIVFSMYAQNGEFNNQIYLELGGHGMMYSLNYERMISEDFSLRAGASAFKFGLFKSDKDEFKIFPVTVNVITGKTKHHNEFGAGVDFIFRNDVSENENKEYIAPIAFAAYRYHYDNGSVLRASFTPFYDIEEEKIIPYFGLSFGKSF